MKKPDLILTADIHLRDDQPVCRTDNYFAALTKKLQWLSDLQIRYGCPILDSGDMFNHWKASPYLLQYAIHNLPKDMLTIPGNHDLPSHSMELYEKSGLGVLAAAKRVRVLCEETVVGKTYKVRGFPWGSPELESPVAPRHNSEYRNVAAIHTMAYTGRLPYPGCKDPTASALLRKMLGYDLIVTGHNHKPFVIEQEGRLIVNPGSLMRSSADQADHKPRVYLWYADTNTVEPVFAPIDEDVVTRVHIDAVDRKEERISAFVERLAGEFEVSLSYENNITEFFGANRVRKGVQDLVWGAISG